MPKVGDETSDKAVRNASDVGNASEKDASDEEAWVLKDMGTCTTRKHDFSKGHFDWSVFIDPRVCPFWLKVWAWKTHVAFD